MPRLYKNDKELIAIKKAYPYYYVAEIDGNSIEIFSNELISLEEAFPYVKREYGFFNKYLKEIALHFDGDYVDISRGTESMPNFQRIRRITGYLVGTLDRFNDAKRAEESERVKHDTRTN